MIGLSLLMLFVFVITVSMVVIVTEGLTKLGLAGVVGFFSLSWAYVLSIWSSFIEFIINPAIDTLLGVRPLDFFGVSTVLVFFSMVLYIAVMVGNIVATSANGPLRFFQNVTKDKDDGL